MYLKLKGFGFKIEQNSQFYSVPDGKIREELIGKSLTMLSI